ncbi:MAG: ATP-binding cassette domain-containing protein [Acidobacteriota bacterium]
MQGLAIETSRLARRYGNLIAVEDLNLRVERGSIYGFLGPNGAGKTTTIRMLLGLIRPNQGDVRLLNESLGKNRLLVLARVGSLVETPSLYSHLTGRENLEVTRRLRGVSRKQIDRVLAIVNLEKDADRKAREYSLGMRQRLGLALALLGDPDLLILDEPTNGLDPAGIHEMRELIRRLPSEHEITVFLSSHLLSEVEQMATHIGIIQKGKLLFEGRLEQLQARMQEHLEIELNQPEEAAQLLTGHGFAVQRNGTQKIYVQAKGRAAAANINSLLVRQGFEVSRLSIERPSLEETFLQMTKE